MSDTSTSKEVRELMSGTVAGDASSFSQLYEQYVTPVYRYLLVRAKNKSLAEDLTQSVFVKAFEHRSALSGAGAKPLAYLYTTARNLLIDYWKKKKEVHQSDASETFEKAPDDRRTPDELSQQNDLSRELIEGLSKLTEEQREVVSLRYLHNFSVTEIAERLNKSEEAVRQLQCRGLKSLRAVIHI